MVGLIAKTKVADVVVIAEMFATVMMTMIGIDGRERRMIVGDADSRKTYCHSSVGRQLTVQGDNKTKQHRHVIADLIRNPEGVTEWRAHNPYAPDISFPQSPPI